MTASGETAGPGRAWQAATALILAGVFVQPVFAGLMLSGAAWARGAHRAVALMLVVATVAAGLAAVVTLRRFPHGRRLGLVLSWLAAAAVLQAALGALTARGANLIWLHVPLGVALVGLAVQAQSAARRLGGE